MMCRPYLKVPSVCRGVLYGRCRAQDLLRRRPFSLPPPPPPRRPAPRPGLVPFPAAAAAPALLSSEPQETL